MRNEKMFSQILQLIDENPYKKWSLDEMASFFHYSPYHFHRMVRRLSGETFQKMVLRRRLSYSAEELMSESKQVIDIALQYEYRSHEAFSRAFKNTFSLTPSSFRQKQTAYYFFKENLLYSSYPKSRDPALNFFPAFSHTGIETTQDQAGKVWGRLVKEINVTNYQAFIGVVDHQAQKYIAGVPQNTSPVPMSRTVTNIPRSLYVSMPHYGSYETILRTYHYLLHTWLPTSNFSYNVYHPQIEIYEKNKPVTICIPIQEVEA